jgi:hypothetical protein
MNIGLNLGLDTVMGAGAPVVYSGALSVGNLTPANLDVTAAGFLDYVVFGDRANTTNDIKKAGAGLIGGATSVGTTGRLNQTGAGQTWSGTDGIPTGDWAATFSTNSMGKWAPQTGSKLQFTAPATTGSRKARIYGRSFGDSGSSMMGNYTVRFTLSDASAAEVTSTVTTLDGNFATFYYEATYTAAALAQTLTISIEVVGAGAGAQLFLGMMAYGT